jgi:hypothetical protein
MLALNNFLLKWQPFQMNEVSNEIIIKFGKSQIYLFL